MKNISGLFFFFIPLLSWSQELFPHMQPASTVPKNVLAIRISNELFKEVDLVRSWQSIQFMSGLSSKLTMTEAFNFSDHHGPKLQPGFISNDNNIGLHTHGGKKGVTYPYHFENLEIGFKYRFLSNDAEHKHFRMAAVLDLAGGNSPHDEAEPSLHGDNAGLSYGLILTYLQHRSAFSFNGQFILPHRYVQEDTATIEIRYGKAFEYGISTGYLLLPRVYKDYKQVNMNVYAEFVGKVYGAASISKNGTSILIEDVPGLEAGNYLEVRPSIQFIFHSNLRLDLSVAEPIIGRSYTKTYPMFYFNLQRYFYFK